YSMIGHLRAYFPKLPFVCLSATFTRLCLAYIKTSLKLSDNLVMIRKPMARPNMWKIVIRIEDGAGYSALQNFVPEELIAGWCIPKTMIFVDDCTMAQKIVEYLRRRVSKDVIDPAYLIKPYSASLGVKFHENTMSSFYKGDTRILVCTNAAGMDVNIGDIERVAQWGVTDHLTLADFLQRAARSGRDPRINACAILFVEGRCF
ncbi:P-loop containing nucleoside triphosphate hydrolase protein, partial [Peziza echinospora]